jgi:hypothetical protein
MKGGIEVGSGIWSWEDYTQDLIHEIIHSNISISYDLPGLRFEGRENRTRDAVRHARRFVQA